MVSTLAGFSGLGWLYYFGWTISILNVMAVFLVAAVGVDCTFIFCSAMKAAGPELCGQAHPCACTERFRC